MRPASAWLISENGARRPLLLEGAGDVRSANLPKAIRVSMQVDTRTRTVEWNGDRGTIRAVAGRRMILKNGKSLLLPRAVRLSESSVVFPEELLKFFSEIFSFVEVANGEEGEILSVQEKAAAPAASEGARPAEVSPDIRPVQLPPTGRAVRTVIIDPGHGGSDPGAKGKGGAIEKDITLGVALQLARLLQENDRSLKVILTRSRDVFVSLHDRARLANTGKGDLFVSIHANSVRRNADADGFEVYHLDLEGANDEARAVAAFENTEKKDGRAANPGAGAASDLNRILGDVMQLQFLDASLELSKHVADGMSASLEGASKFRGSKGAFFYVLKDVMSPAVLVEVGFVTNEWEASFLQKSWYQRKIADGVMQGILNFKRAEDARLNPVPPADSPTPAPGAAE